MGPIPNAIAFLGGHFGVHGAARLPEPGWWFAAAVLAAALRLCAALVPGLPWRRHALVVLAWAVFGLASAGWRAQLALDDRLDPALDGRDLVVEGYVVGMPQASGQGWRTRFRPDGSAQDVAADGGTAAMAASAASAAPDRADADADADPHVDRAVLVPGEIALAWPRERPRAGERWRLTVRLRRPHASANPGLFDAELRALEDGVGATGTVRAAERIAGGGGPWRARVDALRERLRDAMLAAVGDPSRLRAAGVLVALAVGDQNAIPATDWNLFQRTGVSHLMSISGMHVTMLAALGGLAAARLLRWPWLAAALLPRVSRRTLVRIAAVAAAFGYAQLAGWGVPAQRTFWMLAAAALAGVAGRSRSTGDVLAVAAVAVVALDPWAVMSIGFWLSFCAVAVIVWAGNAGPGAPVPAGAAGGPVASLTARLRPVLHGAAVAQAAATLALAPLSAWFFGSTSLVGPLANLFAIPLVTFVVTPAALLGAALAGLSTTVAGWLLGPAAWLTDVLLAALEPMAGWPLAVLTIAHPPIALLLLAAAGAAWLFAPRAMPARGLSALLILPAVLVASERPAEGELWLTAYDVGQGSALLIETPTTRMLYDTGPKQGAGSDAGARVIVPALRARGIDRIDRLVISHADDDHDGGADSVLREIGVGDILASLPDEHPLQATARPCRRGLEWRVDGVAFAVLHPGDTVETEVRSATNAVSCVIAIDAPGGRVLLTGDLEAAQERLLVERAAPGGLKADVLVVPHHGSRTSSSPDFLAAVAPAHAVIQAGWRNKYHHPHPKVLARYEAAGVDVLRTDRDGALRIVLRAGAAPEVRRFRADFPRYWRTRPDET